MSPVLAYPILIRKYPASCLRLILRAPVVGVGLISLGLVSVLTASVGLVDELVIHGHTSPAMFLVPYMAVMYQLYIQLHDFYEGIYDLRARYVADLFSSTKEECLSSADITRMVDGVDKLILGFLSHGRVFILPMVFPRSYKLDLPAPIVGVKFDVEEEDITSVQGKVRSALDFSGHLQHTGATPSLDKRIPILHKQRKGKQPSKWVFPTLFCAHHLTTIAMRNDNLYLVAFCNKSGRWFVLADAMSQFPATVRASRLPFGGKYSDLVEGGHNNLKNYKMMNKMSMFQAVELLANHQEKYSVGSGSEAYNTELKLAMVTVIFVLAEAARFADILEALQKGWQATTSSNITEKHATLVVLWAPMSHALLKYQNNTNYWHENRKQWNFRQMKKCKIVSADDAAGMLNLLLQPE